MSHRSRSKYLLSLSTGGASRGDVAPLRVRARLAEAAVLVVFLSMGCRSTHGALFEGGVGGQVDEGVRSHEPVWGGWANADAAPGSGSSAGQGLGGATAGHGELRGGGLDGLGEGGARGESACGEPATPIYAVQGPGAQSPLVDQRVVIEGIVVGDFQGSAAELGGFFVQNEAPDDDVQTSEGVFVYAGEETIQVAVGERVRVTGVVKEYFGCTEIVAEKVVDCGSAPVPAPTLVSLPYRTPAELEAREGMLVQLRDLTVTDTYDLGRYGEVLLSAGGRLMHPRSDASTTGEQNVRRRIVLDDAREGQYLTPVPYLGSDGTLRLGDTLKEVVAVIHFGFGQYRLEPVEPDQVHFSRENAREATPPVVSGDVRIGSLNVLNYFTTLGERGAHTEAELGRQRTKLVRAVLAMDVDVLGLMEIENAPETVNDFVRSVNLAAGRELYAMAPEPSWLGSDAIRTAILYKPSRLDALQLSAVAADPVFERPPLAQNFSFEGQQFSVVVHHFKSKGSCPKDADDENADLGQGCWNALRLQQAQGLLSFIEQLQVETSDQDVVVVGDLNSYLNEDPVQALEQGGLVNHMRQVPQQARYSYVFGGEAGLLDYAMTTPQIAVAGITVWHINADEPRFLDYNQEHNPPAAYKPDAYRSSDHDPVILGLSLLD